jgi:hypothetical protein
MRVVALGRCREGNGKGSRLYRRIAARGMGSPPSFVGVLSFDGENKKGVVETTPFS